MYFANKFFLLLAFLLPSALIIFLIINSKIKKKLLNKFGNMELMEKLTTNLSYKKRKLKYFFLVAGFFFLLLSLARPQWGTKMQNIQRKGIDIFIAIDTSESMFAEDIKPNRLEKAKFEMSSFIDKLKGDRIGIIAFAGTPFVQCPLTLDYAAAKMFLDVIDRNTVPNPGTAIGDAIKKAIQSFPEKERKYKALILLTDGEDHEGEPEKAAEEANKEGIVIYTIGFGSPSGELIPIKDERGMVSGYKKDRNGQIVMSKLDEVTLEKIALITGGKYYRATEGEIELNKIYEDINNMEKKTLSGLQYSMFEDRYHWFLIPAFLLFLFEMLISERKKTTGRILLLVFLLGSESYANVISKNNKANKLYLQHKYDEALQKYADAQTEAPESKELYFNIGNVYYKQRKYDDAITSYEKVLNIKDADIQAKTYYNIGNCYFQKGDYLHSITSYIQSLKLNPDDNDAKYNLEIARKRLKENIKPQPQQGGQQQQQQGQQGGQQQQGQQKNEDKKQGSGEKKKEISEEDAKRILDALKDEENKLQKNKRQAKISGSFVEKDW